MKTTVKSLIVLKLPSGKGDFIKVDDDISSFRLRTREHGSKTPIFQYKLGSMQQQMALGKLAAVEIKTHHTFKAAAKEHLEHKRTNLRSQPYRDVEPHLLVPVKVLHDLGCTFATPATNTCFIEAALNHVSTNKAGVAGVHNRVTCQTEKRQAPDHWAKYLMAVADDCEGNAPPPRRQV